MKQIKILYIVPNLYASSGVTKIIMNYYKKINREQFKIDFLVMKRYDKNFEEKIDNKSKIYYLKKKFSIRNYLKIKREIKKIFNENRYDIVELHAPTFSFLFLKIAKQCNIPIRIIHSHSTIHSSNKLKNIFSYLLNINLKKYANVFFACSNKSGEYWYGKKICKSDNYRVIKNGINIDKFKFDNNKRLEFRKKYNLENNIVIGFVGRVSRDKNLIFLIDVMKKIVCINNDYKLLIIGDGKKLKKIKNKCKKIKNNVIFLGMRNDVNDLLNCIDLLVLPSKREGLPMVAIEAQLTEIECYLSNTITSEANIGSAKFLKLNKKIWINEILKFKIKKKNINKDEFNIDKCTEQLEKIYKNLYKKK